MVEQITGLAGGARPEFAWQDEQIRMATFAALAAGVRGICFQSNSPLSEVDLPTRRRAALMELFNLELELIEPWCSAGTFVTTATGRDSDLSAAVMQTDRARLVLPLATAPQPQFALRLPTENNAFYVVPGVPEANRAYELSPVGIRPLAQRRRDGGVQVTLPEAERGVLVVLTQDARVIANLQHRIERIRKRAAEWQNDLAAIQLARVEEIEPRLAALNQSTPLVRPQIEKARLSLRMAEAKLAAGDFETAYRHARSCEQLLTHAERLCWKKVAQRMGDPLGVPLAMSFVTLPDYWQFASELKQSRRGANLLAGGDFEDLPLLLRNGWRRFERSKPPASPARRAAAKRAGGAGGDARRASRRRNVSRRQVGPAADRGPVRRGEGYAVHRNGASVDNVAADRGRGRSTDLHSRLGQPAQAAFRERGGADDHRLAGGRTAGRGGLADQWLARGDAVSRGDPLGAAGRDVGSDRLGYCVVDDFSVEVVQRPAAAVQASRPATAASATASAKVESGTTGAVRNSGGDGRLAGSDQDCDRRGRYINTSVLPRPTPLDAACPLPCDCRGIARAGGEMLASPPRSDCHAPDPRIRAELTDRRAGRTGPALTVREPLLLSEADPREYAAGVLTLRGTVPLVQLRQFAESIVSRVDGVWRIDNQVEVFDPMTAPFSDRAVRNAG